MKYWFVTIHYRVRQTFDWSPENAIIDEDPIEWLIKLRTLLTFREIVLTFMFETTKEMYDKYHDEFVK